MTDAHSENIGHYQGDGGNRTLSQKHDNRGDKFAQTQQFKALKIPNTGAPDPTEHNF